MSRAIPDEAVALKARAIIEAGNSTFSLLVKIADLDPGRDLRFAMLDEVDFLGSDLRGFDFTGSSMRKCRFYGARICGAVFVDADLTGSVLSDAADYAEYLSTNAMLLAPEASHDDRPTQSTIPTITAKGGQKLVIYLDNDNGPLSVMAEAITRHLHGRQLEVQSAGVRTGNSDALVDKILGEIGLKAKLSADAFFEVEYMNSTDPTKHTSRRIALVTSRRAILDGAIIISLTPEAHHNAVKITDEHMVEAEYWPSFDPKNLDPSESDEHKEVVYRVLRDQLFKRIKVRFQT